MLSLLFRSQFNPQGELGLGTKKSGSKIRAFSHRIRLPFDEESKGGAAANTGSRLMKDAHREISRWKTSGGVRTAPPVTFLPGSTCPPRRQCARVVSGVALGGAPSRPRRGKVPPLGLKGACVSGARVRTHLLASSLPRRRALGGRGRRRGTGEGSEGAGVAGEKERTGERRSESSEGGKMADRFSRFNEDRDFQVNTGVAGDPGKALAELKPPPLPPALSPSGFCSGLPTG